MIVQFEKIFLRKLTTLGNNLSLINYRVVESKGQVGDSISENTFVKPSEFEYRSELIPLPSIWNKESHTLDITIDLSEDNYKKIYGVGGAEGDSTRTSFSLVVYYIETGITTEVLPAFKLIPSTSDDKYSRLGLLLDGKNHYSVEFPEKTVANITTTSLDEEVEFLESEDYISGVNVYKGFTSSGSPVTRESGLRYLRELVSSDSNEAVYISKQGKKISESTRYIKVYKSISIKAGNLEGSPDKYGNYSYFLSGSSNTIKIVGSVIYDYYEVSEGNYYLLDKDMSEELSSDVTLEMLDGGDEVFKIDQAKKTVSYNIKDELQEISDTYIYAKKVFIDELGSEGFKEVTVRNTIRFIKYAGWKTFANTPFTEQYTDKLGKKVRYPIFVLGHTSGSLGTYELTVSKKVDISRIDFKVEEGREAEFSSNFDYVFKLGDQVPNKYKYIVYITAKYHNGKPDTIPGGLNPILCSLNLGTISIHFFVIQRFSSDAFGLSLATPTFEPIIRNNRILVDSSKGVLSIEGALLPLEDRVGPKSTKFYVTDKLKNSDYSKWGWGKEEQLLPDIYKSEGETRDLVFEYDPAKVKSLVGVVTGRQVNFLKYEYSRDYLGYFTITRRPTNHKYSDLDWRDFVYCNGSDVKCHLYISLNKSDYLDKIKFLASTPYSHQGARLFVFNGGKKKDVNGDYSEVDNPQNLDVNVPIRSLDPSYNPQLADKLWAREVVVRDSENVIVSSKVSKINDGRFGFVYGEYYRPQIFRVELTPKRINKTKKWWGSLDATNNQEILPISVVARDKTNNKDLAEEIIYCVEGGQYQKIRLFTDNKIEAETITSPTPEQRQVAREMSSTVFNMALKKGYIPAGDIIKVGGSGYKKVIARDYRELNSIEFLNDGEPELVDFRFSRNIYVSGESYNDFKYWVITSDNTEDIEVSSKIGELCGIPTKTGDHYQFNEGDLKSTLRVTSNHKVGFSEIQHNPLEFNRLNRPTLSTILEEDFRLDWQYNMYRLGGSSTSLGMVLKGIDVGSLKVSTEFEDKASELSVNYVGLYKLNIKSEYKCNIVLSSTKYIRFFDEGSDNILPDTVRIKEIDSSSYVVPVYFAFLGDSDYTDHYIQDTTITISQIEGSNIKKVLKVHRYTNELSKVSGMLNIGAPLTSGIQRLVGTDRLDQLVSKGNSDVFALFDKSSYPKCSIRVKTKLEAIVGKYKVVDSSSSSEYNNIESIEIIPFFSSRTYDTDRGYLYHDISISGIIHNSNAPEIPLKVWATLPISNPTGESILLNLYLVDGDNQLGYSLNDGRTGKSVNLMRIPAKGNGSDRPEVHVVFKTGNLAQGLVQTINFGRADNFSRPDFELGAGYTIDPKNGAPILNVSAKFVNTTEDNYKYLTTGIAIVKLNENKITRSGFILDAKGNKNTSYTAEDFKTLVGPLTFNIPIYQDGLKVSTPTSVPNNWLDTNSTGEVRSFNFEKSIKEIVPTSNSVGAFETRFNSNYGSEINSGFANIKFFSRPKRSSDIYTPNGLDYSVSDSGKSAMIDVFKINKKELHSGFEVKFEGITGSSYIRDNLDVLESKHGLLVGYRENYGSTEPLKYKLFLGETSEDLNDRELKYMLGGMGQRIEKEIKQFITSCRNVIKVTRARTANYENLYIASLDFPDTPNTIDESKPGTDPQFAPIKVDGSKISSRVSDWWLKLLETSKDISINGTNCNYRVNYFEYAGSIAPEARDYFYYIKDDYGNSCIYWINIK